MTQKILDKKGGKRCLFSYFGQDLFPIFISYFLFVPILTWPREKVIIMPHCFRLVNLLTSWRLSGLRQQRICRVTSDIVYQVKCTTQVHVSQLVSISTKIFFLYSMCMQNESFISGNGQEDWKNCQSGTKKREKSFSKKLKVRKKTRTYEYNVVLLQRFLFLFLSMSFVSGRQFLDFVSIVPIKIEF